MSEIAEDFGIGIGQLMSINRLPSDRIFSGETLLVGLTGESGEVSEVGEYQVRRGDTLSQIAERFGIPLRELMALNGLRGSRIYAGQMLTVQ